MKETAIKLLKYGTMIGVVVIFGLALYVSILLYRMPLEILGRQNLTDVESRTGLAKFSHLEEGSLIDRNNLKKYLIFSNIKDSSESWLKKQVLEGKLEELANNSGLYLVKEALELPALHKNDCSELYCYQHRIGFDYIPSLFWRGLIGIEDYRFVRHFGIDLKAILRALITDIRQMKFVQGGSTLTQQLVKNLFLSSEKKLSRKIKEIVYSIYIELRFEKDEILEGYFNEVYWGVLEGIRIKGLHAASITYFDVVPEEMTPFQATILISMLKGPGYYSPVYHLERLKKRVEIVYKKLVDLYLFPSGENLIWSEQEWNKWQKHLLEKNKNKLARSVWKAMSEEETEFDHLERLTLISAAENVLKDLSGRAGEHKIAAKAIFGVPHKQKTPHYSFYSKFERDREKAIADERHQVGSTLKPIIYSIFFNNGKGPDDKVSTIPIVLDLKSGRWSPREAHKVVEEELLLREALQQSLNRPVIRLAQEIGFAKIEEELLHYIPGLVTPLAEYPAQLLGAVELSVKELYEVFAKFIKMECQKNPQENLLYLMGNPEQTTVRKVVNSQLSKMRFFGKTGTSNNGYDNWFVFYDGYMLGVIWVGFEGSRENVSLNLYGSITAFQIFQKFTRDRGKRFNELSCEGF